MVGGVSIPIQIQLDWDYDASKQSSSYFQDQTKAKTSAKYRDSQRSDSTSYSGSNNFGQDWICESSNEYTKSVLKPPGQFEMEALETHNKYRKKHGLPLLELSNELNNYAKEWADHLAATDSFEHRTDGPYGENLFLSYGFGDTDCDGIEPVDSWYAESKAYSYGQYSGSYGTGHFTQVIWKESRIFGMAKSRSCSGKTIVVANYDPPGNFIGNYAENVLTPKY